MTIKELIAALAVYPADTSVVVNGYEGDFDNPTVGNTAVDWQSGDPAVWYRGIHGSVTDDGLIYRDGDLRAPINPRNVVVIYRRRLT